MGAKKDNFFDKILRKVGLKRTNYTFTAEDRRASLVLRQKRASLAWKKIEFEEKKLDHEINKLDSTSPEDLVMQFFMKVLNGFVTGPTLESTQGEPSQTSLTGYPGVPTGEVPPLPAPPVEVLSKAEIAGQLNKIEPQYRKWLKGKNDEEIRSLAKQHLGVSGPNVEKALEVIHEWP